MLISYGGAPYHTQQQFLAMAPTQQQQQPYIVIPHI